MSNPSRTTEHRKSSRKNWVVGKDDVGRSVLEWRLDHKTANRREADSAARTDNFLKRLDVPDLALEDGTPGCNPYDTGVFSKADRG